MINAALVTSRTIRFQSLISIDRKDINIRNLIKPGRLVDCRAYDGVPRWWLLSHFSKFMFLMINKLNVTNSLIQKQIRREDVLLRLCCCNFSILFSFYCAIFFLLGQFIYLVIHKLKVAKSFKTPHLNSAAFGFIPCFCQSLLFSIFAGGFSFLFYQ